MKVKESKSADRADRADFAEAAMGLKPCPGSNLGGPGETLDYYDIQRLKRTVESQEWEIKILKHKIDLLIEALGAEYVESETIPARYVIEK